MDKSFDRLLKVCSSFSVTILLLLLYVVLLASATIIEKYYGTSVAKDLIYYSPVIVVVQVLLVVIFFLFIGKYQNLRSGRIGLFLTHIAFVIIIVGAFTTHLTGKDGIVHIREGESTKTMIIGDGQGYKSEDLPFSIKLNDFILKRYPGSKSPSSYESKVTIMDGNETIDAHIYMNNVLDIKGYRFFQSSFDQDEKGTILSVSYDVVGRNITYFGYAVLFFSLIFSLIEPNGRFRRLYNKLNSLGKRTFFVVSFLTLACSMYSENIGELELINKYVVNKEHADVFGKLPMQSGNGRMMPINTFSSEVLRKLHKSDKIGNLNSDQFLISLFIMPDAWMRVPLFFVDNEDLVSKFSLSSPYCSYVQVFDSLENYKLEKELDLIYRKNPTERNHMDKAILKLDEQVNIFHSLINRQYINIFPLPEDETHTWYAPGDNLNEFSGKDSMFVAGIFNWYLEAVGDGLQNNDWSEAGKIVDMIDTYQQAKSVGVDISHDKIQTEVQYNKLNIFKYCRIGYLILGGLTLVLAVLGLFGIYESKYIKYLLLFGIISVFAFHLYGMGVRWYIGGYAPWSNSYETMVYVACTIIIAGFIFVKRNLLIFSLATIFSGVVLFVSGLNWMDPQITTLVPVLKSPWLMFHVAVIVAAYGFFGLGCLTGITNMVLMIVLKYNPKKNFIITRIKECTIVNEMSLWIGLVLMTIGTFLGAIWANESWGRYWGWDPKETWALITMLVYAIVTHIHLLKNPAKVWLFNLLSVIGISSVLMTFFGVNYFLSGMHSYGQNDNISNLFVWIILAFVLIAILGFFSYISINKNINLLNKVNHENI